MVTGILGGLPNSWLKEVVLPNNLKSIGNNVFFSCIGLTNITIPDSVTSIGNRAFMWSALSEIDLPDGLTSIGADAFYRCQGLTSITIPNTVTSVGRSAFYDTEWYNNQTFSELYIGKVYYEYRGSESTGTEIKIKEGTTQIGSQAFYWRSGITSITIPSSVTSIGDEAFYQCKDLTTVNYTGTQEQWDQITIGTMNYSLESATIICSDTGE